MMTQHSAMTSSLRIKIFKFTNLGIYRVISTLPLECPEGTQCPRYRGCLPAILYGTEAI